ncbi:ABC transporter permease [Streptomyces sp. NBC_00289]|uniref:ABC transporter permease n=1 Tax=Streptomyces sp. NBC_00289 TaxID=2975703 RepID=UPI00325263D5
MTSSTDSPPALPSYDEPFTPERSPFLWLFERECLRFLTIWRYSVVGPVLSTVLFVVVFGSALGQHVDTVDGVSYGRFIVPGLFAQAIVNVGFFNGTTSLFEARRDRYIHDVFASPLRWWEINAALVSGGVVRGAVVGTGVLAVALPLTGGGSVARPLVLLFGTLGVLLVAAGGRDRGQPRQVPRPRLLHPLIFAGNPGLQAGRECGPRCGGAKRRRSLRLRGGGQAGRFWCRCSP